MILRMAKHHQSGHATIDTKTKGFQIKIRSRKQIRLLVKMKLVVSPKFTSFHDFE